MLMDLFGTECLLSMGSAKAAMGSTSTHSKWADSQQFAAYSRILPPPQHIRLKLYD